MNLGIMKRRAAQNTKANPYITDGLIAMFDAEWNLGLGKHDGNLATWNDITNMSFNGGFDGSGYIWGSNFLQLNNTSFNFIHLNLLQYLIDDSLSVELIYKPLSASSGTYHDVIMINPSTTRGFWVYGNSTYSINNIFYRSRGASPTTSYLSGRWSDQELKKISLYGTKFVDGENEITLNSGGTTYLGTNIIGFNRNKNSKLNLYCIRIYNKVLSQAEITHNALIDKKRFGLNI